MKHRPRPRTTLFASGYNNNNNMLMRVVSWNRRILLMYALPSSLYPPELCVGGAVESILLFGGRKKRRITTSTEVLLKISHTHTHVEAPVGLSRDILCLEKKNDFPDCRELVGWVGQGWTRGGLITI